MIAASTRQIAVDLVLLEPLSSGLALGMPFCPRILPRSRLTSEAISNSVQGSRVPSQWPHVGGIFHNEALSHLKVQGHEIVLPHNLFHPDLVDYER